MKKLMPYLVVGSFLFMASGAWTGIWFSIVGLASAVASAIIGVHVLGDEDKDWHGAMQRSRMAADVYQSEFNDLKRKNEDLRNQVSKALADLREERKRGPLSD